MKKPVRQKKEKRNAHCRGFTLLEVLVVLTILGLLAAMIYPAAGMMNDSERRRITLERMEEIRRAIVGDPDRFDEEGLRIIGGYVGDMEEWPGLYEAAPEVKQHVMGVPPPFDLTDPNNPDVYHYRPSGHFNNDNIWQWDYPFRLLTDDTTHNNDHIGGLETENEGQPRGLWTDDPLGTGNSDDLLDQERWGGPYLVWPKDHRPEDAFHLAESDDDYDTLEPLYHPGPARETWEDGDYGTISGELGEHFDDKEEFRLCQTEDRLEDGWNRALRFFITADPDHPNGTIFWILSEGPDCEGTYPAKGTHDGSSWSVDATDTMALNYDENDDKNQDNIVMKIHSHEWENMLETLNQRRTEETREIIDTIAQGLVGNSLPAGCGFNSGYCGALCRLPRLFQWEVATTSWDDEDPGPAAYTKGQPRGLWSRTPNTADAADNLLEPSWANPAIGWKGAFIATPDGTGEEEKLFDAWGRELLFFRDDTHNSLLILSRGPDGYFDFYDTDTEPPAGNDYREPASPAEALDITTYDPADLNGVNSDNVVRIIDEAEWQPGWFTLEKFTVLNATTVVAGNGTKAAFYYGYDHAAGSVRYVLHNAGVLTDEDGDTLADDWAQGGAPPNEAFLFDDTSADPAITGTRRLVIWNDSDADDEVDVGENQYTINYNILTHGGLEPRDELMIDTTLHFTPAP